MTESFKTPYDALRKTGVAFMANSLNIKYHEVTLLKEYSTHVNDQFKPLFVNLSANNKPHFQKGKEPQRKTVIPRDDDQFLDNWNELSTQLSELLKDMKLKCKGGICEDFKYHCSLIKSDPNLYSIQQLHCDEFKPYNFGDKEKVFELSVLICIERQSFIFLKPNGYDLSRVLMERGDALFMRTDIPHAGTENLTDNSNHRIHCFIYPKDWNHEKKNGYFVKKVTGEVMNPMKWSSKDSKFK